MAKTESKHNVLFLPTRKKANRQPKMFLLKLTQKQMKQSIIITMQK